jgi:hypothetical protein
MGTNDGRYEVLSPWADADPVFLRGIAPRLDDFNNKKIGLLCNIKRASKFILEAIEKELKEKYPTCDVVWYKSSTMADSELSPANKVKLENWIDSVDGVIAAVAD